MPKLGGEKAQAVKKAGEEAGDQQLLQPGVYEVKLTTVKSQKSQAGDPMWVWHFKTVKPLKNVGIREFTSLSEESLWKLAQVFGAFGVEPDTDTDELLGDKIKVEIDIEIAQRGKLKGKEVNTITRWLDKSEEPRVYEKVSAKVADDDEDELPF